MINTTNEIQSTNNFFRQYLLGESLKNVFIRLTVILSSIILVWCGIMFALIIHTKCQRTKQMLKTSSTHHHLYDSNSSLNRKRSNRNRRFNSSSSSISSIRCYSIRRLLSQLKQHCVFSASSTNDNQLYRSASFVHERKSVKKPQRNNYNATPEKVQLVVNSMTRRSILPNANPVHIGQRISLYQDADHSSGDELKNLYSNENDAKSDHDITQDRSSPIRLTEPKVYIHHTSISLPISQSKDIHPAVKHLPKLRQFNTRAALFFEPITRRFSNTNVNTCLPPTNAIQQQLRSKPLLMVSSARELTSNNEWKVQHSVIEEPNITDGSRTSSSRHIPLVMITDTSSSNTNILELETFEDKQRLIDDIERNLSKELRASYQPRHST